jgi:hypothetical protein
MSSSSIKTTILMAVTSVAALASVIFAGFYAADSDKSGWKRILAIFFILSTVVGSVAFAAATIKGRDPKADQATLKKLNIIAIVCLLPALIAALFQLGSLAMIIYM